MDQFDANGMLVVEHWWTTLFLGTDVLADAGPEPPDHTFPEEARQHPVGSATQHVDVDIAQRYGELTAREALIVQQVIRGEVIERYRRQLIAARDCGPNASTQLYLLMCAEEGIDPIIRKDSK